MSGVSLNDIVKSYGAFNCAWRFGDQQAAYDKVKTELSPLFHKRKWPQL
jgi:hypothetical protein